MDIIISFKITPVSNYAKTTPEEISKMFGFDVEYWNLMKKNKKVYWLKKYIDRIERPIFVYENFIEIENNE